MTAFHVRRLPERSAILAGRGPVEAGIGCLSSRLQVWYCNAGDSWNDEREHAHEECDECFLVLRGAVVVAVDGEEHVIGPRQYCVFPPGVFHRVVRATPPVEALVIRAPAHDDKIYR